MRLLRVNLDLVFAAGFQVVFVWNYFVSSTAATCNDEQIHNCRKSASNNQLDQLSGGGVCQPKQYVQYTHICTVSHYLPIVDYCCCQHEQRVLCCRYHQDWDVFRCSQGEDTVDTVSSSSLPLKILLPVIIGPIVLLLCCVFCCIKCCCYKYDDDADMLCCSSCDDRREKVKEKPAPATNRSPAPPPDDASIPLTYGMAPAGSNTNCPNCRHSLTTPDIKALPFQCHHPALEPTAPPEEDPYSSPYAPSMCLQEKEHPASNYARQPSQHSDPIHCGCPSANRSSVYRSLSCGGHAVDHQRPPCPTCQGSGQEWFAPPSYDESQNLPNSQTATINVHCDADIAEKC